MNDKLKYYGPRFTQYTTDLKRLIEEFPKFLVGRAEAVPSRLKKPSYGPVSAWFTELWSLVFDDEAQDRHPSTNRALADFAYNHRHSSAVFETLESFIDQRKAEKLSLSLRLLSQPLLGCQSLLKIARNIPSMQRTRILTIQSPAPLNLTRGHKVSLQQAWNSLNLPPHTDPQTIKWMSHYDATFQRDCGMRLRLVHAEVQLVDFYRRQPNATPSILHPYIGCSKKACFMCQLFLDVCKLKLRNRGCHGIISKIPWTVPCTPAPHLDEELAKMTAFIVERISTVLRSPQPHLFPQRQSEIGSSVHDELIYRPYPSPTLARYKEILEEGRRKITSL